MKKLKLTKVEKAAIRSMVKIGIMARNGMANSGYPTKLWFLGYLEAIKSMVQTLPFAREIARSDAMLRRWKMSDAKLPDLDGKRYGHNAQAEPRRGSDAGAQ